MTTAEKSQVLVLISDFNLANLGSILAKNPDPPLLILRLAPFGQVMQALLNQIPESSFSTPGAGRVLTVSSHSIVGSGTCQRPLTALSCSNDLRTISRRLRAVSWAVQENSRSWIWTTRSGAESSAR